MTSSIWSAEVPVWELPFDLGCEPDTIAAGPDGATRRIFSALRTQWLRGGGFSPRANKEVARISCGDRNRIREPTPARDVALARDRRGGPYGKYAVVTSIPNNAVFAIRSPTSAHGRGRAGGPALTPAAPDAAAIASVPELGDVPH